MVDSSDIDKPLPKNQAGFARPQGTLEVSAIRGLQNVTLDTVKAAASNELLGLANPVRKNLFARIDEWGKANIVAPLQQIFAGLKPPGWEKAAEAFQDGQKAITNRLDLLNPFLHYGYFYMHSKGGFLQFNQNSGRMPFNHQLGPATGCEPFDGGVRLLEHGLWSIQAQIAAGDNALHVGSGWFEVVVRTYDPQGRLYSQQFGRQDSVRPVTNTVTTSVVVPEPGYVVRLEISWVHGSREILGGPANNRLIVKHISNKLGVGDTGAEDSYTPRFEIPDERG